MGAFLDGLNAVASEATSADRTVRVTKGRGDFVIALNPRVRDLHDDASLGDTITDTVTAVRRHYADSLRVLLRRSGRRARARPDAARDERKREYLDALAEIVVKQRSPRDIARMRVRGDGAFGLRLQTGTLQRIDLGVDALANEINSVVNDGMRRYHGELRAVQKRYYTP